MRFYPSAERAGVLEDGVTPLYHAPQYRRMGTTLAVKAPNGQLLAYFENLAQIDPRAVQTGASFAIAKGAVPARARDPSYMLLHTIQSAQPQSVPTGARPEALPLLPLLMVGLFLLIVGVAAWITVQAIRSWRTPPCQQRTFDVSERTAGAMSPSCEIIYFDKQTGEEVGRSEPPGGPTQQLGSTVAFVAIAIGVAVLIAKAGPAFLARRPRRGRR